MGLFNHQSFIWKPFGYLADLLLLSLVWILCCIPVISAGASTAALYDAVARGIRGGESFPVSRFWRSFKNGFGSMCVSTIIWGLFYSLLAVLALKTAAPVRTSELSYTLAWAGLVLLLIPFGIGLWLPPLHSRFTFTVLGLNTTAFRLSLGKVHITMLLAVSTALAILLVVRFIIPIFILPALLMLLWSVFLEPIFRQYEDSAE